MKYESFTQAVLLLPVNGQHVAVFHTTLSPFCWHKCTIKDYIHQPDLKIPKESTLLHN